MVIRFWGVRGSIPTPLTPEQVQAKIVAAVERITPRDIASQDARTRFLATLPDWLFGSLGGNSPCVELETDNGNSFILDAGSGLREYAIHGKHPKDLVYRIFMSHFHWDHIQGIPFFNPVFNPKAKIELYSAFPDAERILSVQNSCPYFPPNCKWENIKDRFHFHLLKNHQSFLLNGVKISMIKMKHPGNSYTYSFEENGKKIIFATDVELRPDDFDTSIEYNHFFDEADILILDSQYNYDEAERKKNWGHNIVFKAVDFANLYKVKKLYLFHHEPTYSDQKIYSILHAARWYAESSANKNLEIELAIEGQEIEI